jgi:hypothetical protein
MIFEQIRSGGCLSYLVGCEERCAGAIIDPALDRPFCRIMRALF